MPSHADQPIRLLPLFRERVWGCLDLSPYFTNPTPKGRIGEIWYTFSENRTSLGVSLGDLLTEQPALLGSAGDPAHPGVCPLLVKMLFTTERLSVQVHPDDEYANQYHQSLGKTEAWYVVDAKPPADVALGFREPISRERLRESAQTGEIEQLLDWRKVKAGDVIYTPAGTVHAIGAGLTICEIQENSDITYRLYDYGRPRELHLDHAARVSHLGPYMQQTKVTSLADWRDQLAVSAYFRIERLRPSASFEIAGGLAVYALLICLKGAGKINSDSFAPGDCWMVPAGAAPVKISENSEWILTYKSDHPLEGLTGS